MNVKSEEYLTKYWEPQVEEEGGEVGFFRPLEMDEYDTLTHSLCTTCIPL